MQTVLVSQKVFSNCIGICMYICVLKELYSSLARGGPWGAIFQEKSEILTDK